MTPIQNLNKIGNNNIFIKRDDLLGFSFGGNKVRIAQEFFKDMRKKGADCIIGYGSSRSNLCRAIANMSYSKGIPCHIVSPFEEDGTHIKSNNSDLVERCNVILHYCKKQNVAETVENVINECKAQGLNPYYINGDKYGNGNERVPLYAYERAYAKIKEQAEEEQISFDYIFLPTGTGMTQSGLLLGLQNAGGIEKIVGISIARDAQKEKQIIKKFLKSAGVNQFDDKHIVITDKYLCGGYGKYNDSIEKTIFDIYKKYGIPLDPTYTGKAFSGMLEFLKENNIENKNILFIHTGGTPLFFDFLQSCKPKTEVVVCKEKEKLIRFLERIDEQLVTSLSARVEFTDFAEKVLNKGNVFVIEKDGEITSAVLFYDNDLIKKSAYVTLLGTLPEAQGKRHASVLMHAMETKARINGMQKVYLDTDLSNTKAIAFYSKNGYMIESISEKVHMVKEI